MASILDRDEFNETLFYARALTSPPHRAVDRFVEVGDVRLHVRCHTAASARCTLLLFHGNGEVVADYDNAADDFAEIGVALAVADFRGYGQSEGTPTLRTVISDARPIAEAVRSTPPLVVMGRSLGGAAAHELYARPIEGMVGVILESAFYDLQGLISRRGLTPPAAFTDDELATFDPATKLRRGQLPLLVLHGALDTLIEPSEAAATFAAAGSTEKQLVIVPDRGHNDVSFSDVYWDALAAFIARLTP
jgi:hypothetical protein